MADIPQAEIGIFGGSGFYSLLEEGAQEVKIDTPYGDPSDVATVGTIAGRKVAFIPRHGKTHSHAPADINYRANLWAMKELGVTQIIGPSSVGSLRLDVHPGDFVITDQVVDRTWGRKDTFFGADSGRKVTHISYAEPYCPEMRKVAIETCKALGYPVHEAGTLVTIQGPRFSTKAESEWFSSMGWSTVNMTQYPECYLARELEICYCNIALVTDYDAGCGEHEAVTNEDVLRVFNENIGKVKQLIFEMVPKLPTVRSCACKDALGGAEM
ncbi:MAG: S-methyl-5'-thioadenosine phosphorylase [Coriobacteriales bacterium]|jgi:5'-methylthioadenosine phosphorylase